jgi:hypothetical protein
VRIVEQGSTPGRHVQGSLFRGSLVHVASYYGSRASLSYVWQACACCAAHCCTLWGSLTLLVFSALVHPSFLLSYLLSPRPLEALKAFASAPNADNKVRSGGHSPYTLLLCRWRCVRPPCPNAPQSTVRALRALAPDLDKALAAAVDVFFTAGSIAAGLNAFHFALGGQSFGRRGQINEARPWLPHIIS